MILAVGPLTAFPPMSGVTAITGTRAARTADSSCGTPRAAGRQLQVRIGGADDDGLERRGLKCGERRRRKARRGRALIGHTLHARRALVAHEVILEGELAVAGCDAGADRIIAHRHDRRFDPKPSCEVSRDGARRLAPPFRRCVRSTCSARSASPRRNHVSPPRASRVCMNVHRSHRVAPSRACGIGEPGERVVERGVEGRGRCAARGARSHLRC